jgi:hypothetical protein
MLHLAGKFALNTACDPRHRDPRTFLEVINPARVLQCVDGRDKIYTFLAHPVACDMDHSGALQLPYQADQETFILPSYDHAYSFRRLYFDAAKTMIQDRHAGLDLLSHTKYHAEALDAQISSWVPRWDLPAEPLHVLLSQTPHSASGGLPAQHMDMFLIMQRRSLRPSYDCVPHASARSFSRSSLCLRSSF